MRDFKCFTSRTIHDRLLEDGRTSLLRWIETAREPARQKRGEFSFWQPGFHPQAVYSDEVLVQKLDYIHNNPVRKGLVCHPADWFYSSASLYEGREQTCIELDDIADWA